MVRIHHELRPAVLILQRLQLLRLASVHPAEMSRRLSPGAAG